MLAIDRAGFLLLNAGPHPAPVAVAIATFLARDLVWLVPAGLALGWLRCGRGGRLALVSAAVAGLAGLAASLVIGWAWPVARPFAQGLGHLYLAHAADSSFPSDHLTLIWGVGAALVLRGTTRRAGVVIALAGLPVAWARIYLGVHFPSDMAGAAAVGLACALIVRRGEGRVVAPVLRLMLRSHAVLLGPAIRRGWVRQ